MKRVTRVGILAGTMVLALAAVAGGAPAGGSKVESVTLGIRHRVFHDFRDVERVRLNQDFLIGDGEFSGRAIQYVPDFQMDLATRKVVSRSDQPNNPAFRIVVRQGKVPQDTTWAFLNLPPHFGRKSYFAFQILRIDFAGRAPLLADTTTARPPTPPAPPADAAAHPAPAPAGDSTAHR